MVSAETCSGWSEASMRVHCAQKSVCVEKSVLHASDQKVSEYKLFYFNMSITVTIFYSFIIAWCFFKIYFWYIFVISVLYLNIVVIEMTYYYIADNPILVPVLWLIDTAFCPRENHYFDSMQHLNSSNVQTLKKSTPLTRLESQARWYEWPSGVKNSVRFYTL